MSYSGVPRNEKGYPLLPDGSIDWELCSKEKTEFEAKFLKESSQTKKIRKSANSHLTPKKKKRK